MGIFWLQVSYAPFNNRKRIMVQCNKEGRDRHDHEYRLTVSLVGRAVIMYYQDLQTDFIVHVFIWHYTDQ